MGFNSVFKGLMDLESSQQIFEKFSSIKLGGSVRKDRQTWTSW